MAIWQLVSPKTTTGLTVYSVVNRESDGFRWNRASGFEALTAADWSGYAYSLAEVSGTGYYQGAMPSGLVGPGLLVVNYFNQVGSGPSISSDVLFGVQSVDWNGLADTGWNSSGAGSLSGQLFIAPKGLDGIQIESGVNMRQAQSPILAATAGRLSGAGTTTILIDGGNVSGTNRITAVVDNSGNRTQVMLNLPT